MPKIALVWNTDPNESAVTYSLARLLKIELEKRKFNVEIVKAPLMNTRHGNKNYPSSYWQWTEQLTKRFFGDVIIELHTTLDSHLIKPYKSRKYWRRPELLFRRPKNWSATFDQESDGLLKTSGEISIENFDNETPDRHAPTKIFILEVPAKYKPMPTPWKKRFDKWHAEARYGYPSETERYFVRQADLKGTKRANYLSPAVIGKVVHLIDEVVKITAGIYRYPRQPPNRSRKQYPLSNPPKRMKGKSSKAKQKFLRRHGR